MYVCPVCRKCFETPQALGGHMRMAHPKRKGRRTKERLFLDFLKALLETPVRFKNKRPVIHIRDVAQIMKISTKKAKEIYEWGLKNGYAELIEVISSAKVEQVQQKLSKLS